jgi:CRP-like cAMP-binding protein
MIEDEILRALAKAEIFKGLTQDEVKLFYDSSQRMTFDKAATLIEKGQAGSALYVILKGEFELDLRLAFMYLNRLQNKSIAGCQRSN